MIDTVEPTNSELLAMFQMLPIAKQKEWLKKALADSAWRKPGAGVDDDAFEKNQTGYRAHNVTGKPQRDPMDDTSARSKAMGESIREDMKRMFRVDDQALDQMVTIFEAAVDARAAGATESKLMTGLKQLFAEYGGFFVPEDEVGDTVVVALCDHYEALLAELEQVEREKIALRQHIAQHRDATAVKEQCQQLRSRGLNEEAKALEQLELNEATRKLLTDKPARRSRIAEDLDARGEIYDASGNIVDDLPLLVEQNRSSGDPKMQSYLARIAADSALLKKR
jgi:hypothetical protein